MSFVMFLLGWENSQGNREMNRASMQNDILCGKMSVDVDIDVDVFL